MHDLILTQALTMSSREIAELVESRHDDVKRSIDRLAERGVITLPPLAEVSNPGPGPKKIEVYLVGKRDSYIIVAQLSPEFTARLVDRWQELEAAQQPRIPQSLPEALRLAADLAEQKAALQAKIEADKPKVQFAEAIRNLDGSCLVREFAKVVGTGQNKMYRWLRESGYLMANNQPYQEFIDRGFSSWSRTRLSPTARAKATPPSPPALLARAKSSLRRSIAAYPGTGWC